ncbi:MAG: DUF2341 domain-containing protein, partial [Bacteroidota bacterium]
MISLLTGTIRTRPHQSPSKPGLGGLHLFGLLPFRSPSLTKASFRLPYILLTLLFAFFLVPELRCQWLDGYCYRKQITIQESQIPDGTEFTNFPVLINILSDTDLEDESHSGYVNNSNGWDLVFTSSDGISVLNHQVEHYDPTTGEYIAWVQVPTLDDNNDTELYLYFGYDAPASDPSTENTWSNGYVSVYHLHDDYLDAAGSNNGLASGVANAEGKIGNGEIYDANSDYISIATSGWALGSGTIEAWANTSGNTTADYLIGHSTGPPWGNRIQLYVDDGGAPNNLDLGLGDSHTRHTDIVNMSADSWYHVVLTWDGSNYEVYVDGTSSASGTYTGLGAFNATANIGNEVNNQARGWNGLIDEFRISTSVRSANWIATEYNNQNTPESFYSLGILEDNPPTAVAGDDQDICGVQVATLAGNEPTIGTGTWTKVSGPGNVTFADENVYNTTATVDAYGTYELRWTIVNGTCSSQDEVIIGYAEGAVAGGDQDICGVQVATLAGNEPTIGTGTWTKVSGPGNV